MFASRTLNEAHKPYSLLQYLTICSVLDLHEQYLYLTPKNPRPSAGEARRQVAIYCYFCIDVVVEV